MPYIIPDSHYAIFTIASGQSTSNAVCLSGQFPVGFYIPAGGWNASGISFLASVTGGTFVNMVQWQNGQRLELTVTASSYTDAPYDKFLGVQYLALQTTYTGSALAQTGARVISALLRPF